MRSRHGPIFGLGRHVSSDSRATRDAPKPSSAFPVNPLSSQNPPFTSLTSHYPQSYPGPPIHIRLHPFSTPKPAFLQPPSRLVWGVTLFNRLYVSCGDRKHACTYGQKGMRTRFWLTRLAGYTIEILFIKANLCSP